ncbi:MAG: glycosyltransferase family 4 protein, partial [Nanoarchaeota archaeon]
VTIAGKMSYEALSASGIYGAADVFVTTSTTETGPLTVLEAASCGTPTVCLKAKGTSDIVVDGVNGFLFDEGDKQAFADRVIKLISNKKLLSSMRKKTKKMIAKHSQKVVMDEWEALYRSMIAKNRKRK